MADIETHPAAALAALGLELPELADDPKYLNSRATANGEIYISGQLPYVGGKLPISGVVGDTVDVDSARAMMARATLNAMAVGAIAAGGLERLRIANAGVRPQCSRIRRPVASRGCRERAVDPGARRTRAPRTYGHRCCRAAQEQPC
ncbi:hypothetical protein [Flexivirga alba]|uniref:RidA family protein n=1 Tax=Flexivirga alba TaxID=702742 RepID=A0ABW2AGC4_9MICO